jgi:hypothetical protein
MYPHTLGLGGIKGYDRAGPICSALVFPPRSKDWIELGSGQSGSKKWRLMYDPVGPFPRDGHHITGPGVGLFFDDGRGGGRPLARVPLQGSLGRPEIVFFGGSTAYYFGPVAFGFDRVQLDSADEETVAAQVIDCADYLPFNHYVANVASRVVRVTATSPDGRTATREHPPPRPPPK